MNVRALGSFFLTNGSADFPAAAAAFPGLVDDKDAFCFCRDANRAAPAVAVADDKSLTADLISSIYTVSFYLQDELFKSVAAV